MRLNLGCGPDIKSGYVNVDFRSLPGVDRVEDLSKFPWPFEDESADEILMLDFLEHFPYRATSIILLECHRILKADGTVVIQVPDGDHLAMALTGKGPFLCNRCGGDMHDRETSRDVGEFVCLEECPDCGQSRYEIADAAMMRLYGGQDYPGNFHYTCFTMDTLSFQAYTAGLKRMGIEEADHQYKNWNFKARFAKGDLW